MLNLELMRDKLKQKNKSLRDVAAATELSYSVVSKVFSGYIGNPTSTTILPICKYLDLNFEDVWQDDEMVIAQRKKTVENLKDEELYEDIKKLDLRQKQTVKNIIKAQLGLKPDEKVRTLPLINQSACAGTGNYYDVEDSELIEFSNPPITANFCIRIQGNSMEPAIDDGQVVFIRDNVDLQPGDVGIFCYQGDIFCKIYKYRNGQIILSSCNPKYKDMVIEYPDELKIIGRVL